MTHFPILFVRLCCLVTSGEAMFFNSQYLPHVASENVDRGSNRWIIAWPMGI